MVSLEYVIVMLCAVNKLSLIQEEEENDLYHKSIYKYYFCKNFITVR